MSGHGLLERMLGDQLIVNGMLIVIAVITLTFAFRNLRHRHRLRRSGDRRPDVRSRPRPVSGEHSPAPPRRPPPRRPIQGLTTSCRA